MDPRPFRLRRNSSDGPNRPHGRVSAFCAWALVGVVIVGTLLTRGHDRAWPLVAWVMYLEVANPPDVVRVLRVDAVLNTGEKRSFFPAHLLTPVEAPFVHDLMSRAFGDTPGAGPSRRTLVSLITKRWPEASNATVTGWRVEWDRAPEQTLNRIDRRRPDREIALGAFEAEKAR